MSVLLTFGYAGTAVPLADSENDELCGLHWSDADHTDQPAVIYVCLGHGGVIAPDKICLLFLRTLQHSVAPQSCEKVADAAPHPRPQWLVIVFENHPLRASQDGFFDENEQAANIDVFPVGIIRGGTAAPDQISSAPEVAQNIHALGVQNGLLLVIGLHLQFIDST